MQGSSKKTPEAKAAIAEIIKRTGWKMNTLYNKLWYRGISIDTLTMADIDRLLTKQVNKRKRPNIEKWIAENHPECDLTPSTIRYRSGQVLKIKLTQVPVEEYEDLYQQIINCETKSYEKSDKQITYKLPLSRYLWWTDILPLKEALARGIYTDDGLLNVFKDPNQQKESEKSITMKEYLDYGTKERNLPVVDIFLGSHDFDEDKVLPYYVNTHEDAFKKKKSTKSDEIS